MEVPPVPMLPIIVVGPVFKIDVRLRPPYVPAVARSI